MTNHVSTIGMRELKKRVSEIIHEVETGKEFIITKHGRVCGKLSPLKESTKKKRNLLSLMGASPELPELTDEDFQEIKKIWHVKEEDGATLSLRSRYAYYLLVS